MASSEPDNLPNDYSITSAGATQISTPPVAQTLPDQCVICLDVITEKAIALPCRHEQFDFPCLGQWLQHQQVCPLCKGEVKAIRYDVHEKDSGGSKTFYLPPPVEQTAPRSNIEALAVRHRFRRARHQRHFSRPWDGARPGQRPPGESRRTGLAFRKVVYQHGLFSLHVGSNRISRYRAIKPTSFQQDDNLVSRARAFVRRELSVFDFLSPDSESLPSSSSSSSSTGTRRANNADFLLEYIISILKSIDLKGSTGQAEELLTDFLGRDHARLFIHELQAWLRSPYERLEDWDRNVQYAVPDSALEGDDASHLHIQNGKSQQPLRHASASAGGVPRWFSDRFVLRDKARATSTAIP
ncbi:hypothetical protein LTR84_004418 [Exophiala bonariae]|uniref:RING-type E3 ubiquitin transferase n=1 Tax=Exophiala bonariae TaxID=1690606 RepID=A0AAV9N8T4_9EURO|nr:hypothetical protein LTR84_004418 [Exophiala bonariae]